MLKELEDVLVLIRDLPVEWQQQAAKDLGRMLRTYEEMTFMSREEAEKLNALRHEEHRQRMAEFRQKLRDWGKGSR